MIAAALAEEEAMMAKLMGKAGAGGSDSGGADAGGGAGGGGGDESNARVEVMSKAPAAPAAAATSLSGPIDASLFQGEEDDDLDDLDLDD